MGYEVWGVGCEVWGVNSRGCLKSQNLLNARGAKDLRKARKCLIVSHLFFATFAKIPCVFALRILLRHLLQKTKNLLLISQRTTENSQSLTEESNKILFICVICVLLILQKKMFQKTKTHLIFWNIERILRSQRREGITSKKLTLFYVFLKDVEAVYCLFEQLVNCNRIAFLPKYKLELPTLLP